MKPSLRVLLVEDCEDDALLVERALRRGGLDIVSERVDSAAALSIALLEQWDVVISDFSMRGFTGLDALALCRAGGSDRPFILISGAIGEAAAAAAMKAGASDYVMKHNLTRLAPAVLRELNEAVIHADLQRTELQLIDSERRFHAFMNASPFIASIVDDSGATVYRNDGWINVFGDEDTVLAEGLQATLPNQWHAKLGVSDLEVLSSGIAIDSVEEISSPGAPPAFWKNTRFPFLGASGQRLLGRFATDITKLKQSEEIIRKLAYQDPLTDLPNRRMLLDRLAHAMAISARSGSHGALLFFDLDHFKAVNDQHGHDAGDQLLQQTAQRLRSCTRLQDTVSRSGGDEFVIILESLSEEQAEAAIHADVVGKKILATINAPFLLHAGPYEMTASIGIVLFCRHEQTPDSLMKHADLALYSAKIAGRNRHLFFDPAMQARLAVRNALEADLREGLKKNQFELHYQPQIDCSGRMTGVEALLRLQHPDKGLIMPTTLIGIAEETGLIIELGNWVLHTACRQLLTWSASNETAHLTMSVNVSARQFNHPEFVPRVLEILDCSGANPDYLILELTESLLLDDIDVTIDKMVALRKTGLRFSLDDFGTGYSSLSYLKRLPLYEIKIDRSFVNDILQDANDAVIVRAIIALGHSFGLSIIAEGVEDSAQRDFLTNNGCTRFQGFLFGAPVPVAMLDIHVGINVDVDACDQR